MIIIVCKERETSLKISRKIDNLMELMQNK